MLINLPQQSIITRDLPPTNTLPARVRATAAGGATLVISRHACPSDYRGDAHDYAARKLADKLNWHGEMIPGTALNGYGYVYVFDCGRRV